MESAYVLTGVTSGFGAVALARIRECVANPIIVGARSAAAADALAGGQVRVLPLNLESLASVRRFCGELAGVPVCGLGLNARG
ncbi:MAG: hypothetical protein AAGA68_11965 [Pseudomonadota bacterium]